MIRQRPGPNYDVAQYINNADLLASLIVWLDEIKIAKAEDKPRPPIPDYVAEAIMKITERMSKKYSFCRYSYADDMRGLAILHCCTYIDRFNPAKSSNAFSYISSVVTNSFLRVIQNEKRQVYTKLKMMQAVQESMPARKRRTDSEERTMDEINKYEEAAVSKKERQAAAKAKTKIAVVVG